MGVSWGVQCSPGRRRARQSDCLASQVLTFDVLSQWNKILRINYCIVFNHSSCVSENQIAGHIAVLMSGFRSVFFPLAISMKARSYLSICTLIAICNKCTINFVLIVQCQGVMSHIAHVSHIIWFLKSWLLIDVLFCLQWDKILWNLCIISTDDALCLALPEDFQFLPIPIPLKVFGARLSQMALFSFISTPHPMKIPLYTVAWSNTGLLSFGLVKL